MKTRLAILLLFLAGNGQGAFEATHGRWDVFLKEHVTVKGPVSTVDYRKAKTNASKLQEYLASVSAVKRAEYNGWPAAEKMAFLINAYNAFTVRLIVDNYPVKSIKDLGSLFKSPWKKEFFTLFGESENLDGIEHGILRKEFKEPRIHAAVVCASIGCPMLRNEAWTAEKLEAQLEESMKLFLSDAARNRYDAQENRFTVSKIFDWYADDFKGSAGSVQAFLARYYAKTSEEKKKLEGAKLSYTDYDWRLNETK